jgi:hypothetical protein
MSSHFLNQSNNLNKSQSVIGYGIVDAILFISILCYESTGGFWFLAAGFLLLASGK